MILFAGDPHGRYRHLEEAARHQRPAAIVLLGDNEPPTPETLPALNRAAPVFYILGNHDTDRAEALANHEGLGEADLNATVREVAGVRVAGLAGVFREKVWHPEKGLKWARREDLAARTPKHTRFRGGPPLRHWSTIWWEDYAALWEQSADILVCHEAPESHPHGFEAIGDLARALGVHTVFHGHHHENYDGEIAGAEPSRPIAVRGVAKCGMADLAGSRLGEGTERQRPGIWPRPG
jgi:predicted phosphodiesterase